MAEVKKE
jgi:small subunit ribosomal protein S14e